MIKLFTWVSLCSSTSLLHKPSPREILRDPKLSPEKAGRNFIKVPPKVIPYLLKGARNTGWNLNKMFHSSSLSFSLSLFLLCKFLPLPPLTWTLSPTLPSCILPPSVLVSVRVSWCYGEKRRGQCLINNVTQADRMSLDGGSRDKMAGIFSPPPLPLTPQLDLFNLGDKCLSDLAAVFLFCLLLFRRVFLPFSSASLLAF